MTYREYYGDPFRNDIHEVIASRPTPDRHILEGREAVIQPHNLTTENPAICSWASERLELFATTLFFTTLVDQVCYSYYRDSYPHFQSLTRYPKFKGDCPGGCNSNLHPRSIFRVVGIGSISSPIFDEAVGIMRKEVIDFFQNILKNVDGGEFWRKCLNELPKDMTP